MIARYTLPQMGALWSDRKRFETWLQVELALLKVLEDEKKIPRGTSAEIGKKAKIKVERILELEETLKHDVIAFTTSISEQVGESGRFFHYGLTSSDVVDTSLSLLLKEALEILEQDLLKLDKVLVKMALKYKSLPCMGRTHGVHAEPSSFGLKFLGWVAEFRRQAQRLHLAKIQMQYGKLSGAVGAYGALTPEIESKALQKLGLVPEPVATQVIPRDRHAQVFSTLAEIGASVERVAVELRHLQRTEVRELEEGFSKGQKGSSAMPHKKNPISAENLTGCARLLRGYATAALENVALWHERDISHSSVERVAAPDSTILLDYMLNRLVRVVEGLSVIQKNVDRNLEGSFGIYFSGHVLLSLVEKGLSREEAYHIVQKAAHTAWDQERPFKAVLEKEPLLKKTLTRKELENIFNIKNFLRHVDKIYERVLDNSDYGKHVKDKK